MRIVSLDQIDFPLTVPALQLLFAQDRRLHVAEHFEAHEAMDLVPCDEATGNAFAVLPEPLHKVGCDPDIERSTRLAREDVDAGFAFERHPPVIAARWMLKQVQHDGMGAV